MERKRIIVITPEERKYLQKMIGCSGVTVWEAVKYRKSNDIHKRIRKAAIERGGQQMVLTPEFEAIYITNREDADKGMHRYMVQSFENGATLEGCFDTGLVVIRDKRGEVRGEWQSPRLTEIAAIQEVAMSL
ncbi:hypothetical protein FDZ78_01600 [Duncaniella sp. B8]|uniref:hypothetical protein n=1 Tax=Duncaniella sp. B8 TaxID=2576606 RepID=UPI0010CA4A1C|nr:hypothetical protein [Duncaniella sp. B8]QCP71351.1 hypothetical protein FDZ78_01600 [Duncaniella sp. B8]